MARDTGIGEAAELLAQGRARDSLYRTNDTLEAYVRYLAVSNGAAAALSQGDVELLAGVPLQALIDYLIDQSILRYRHKADIREVRRLVDEARRRNLGPSLEQATWALRFLREFVDRNETAAGDIMRSPVLGVDRYESVGRAVSMMRERGLHQLPVLADGVPVRCLTTGMVQRLIDEGISDLARRPVWDVAERAMPQITTATKLPQILSALRTHPALLVVDDGRVVGIIASSDVLRVLRVYS